MNKAYNNFYYAIFIPICILPIAIIISQIGQFLYANSGITFTFFLIQFQEVCIANLPIMLAASVSYFMNKQRSGIAVFSGVISFLILTQIIDSDTLKTAFNVSFSEIDTAYSYLNNTLFGILCGLLAAQTFNHFQSLRLPTWLAFFSGRRSIPIITTMFTILCSIILYYIWPTIFHFFIDANKLLLNFNPLTQALAVAFNQLLSLLISQNFINNFIVVPQIQQLLVYISVFSIPIIATYYCYYKKADYYIYIFLFIIALSTYFSQNTSIIAIILLMVSPFLWLSYCFLLGACVFLTQTLYISNIVATVIFTIFYFFILKFAIHKNWLINPWHESFITALPIKTIKEAIQEMGGFENIKSVELEYNKLVFYVYDYDFINFKKIKQLTRWKIKQREDYSFLIIDDIHVLQLLHQDIIELKNQEMKALVL